MLIVSKFTFSQKMIKMEVDGGVYKIPCIVNGAKMKMIFDTGASTVSISMNIANFLYENNYISKEDILGRGLSQTASGDIVDHIVINLKDIELDGLHLRNIKATVIDGQNVPLLLGQTALKELGRYTINGNILVLNDAPSGNITDSEANKLRNEYSNDIGIGNYYSAKEALIKLKEAGRFTIEDYDALSVCCYNCGEDEECIEVCRELLSRTDVFNGYNDWCGAKAQMTIGDCYYNLENYEQAILWYQKTMSFSAEVFTVENLSHTLKYMALSYGKIGNKKKCMDTYNMLFLVDGIQKYDAKEDSKTTSKKYKAQEFVKTLSEDFTSLSEACILKYVDLKPSVPLHSAIRMLCDYLGYDYKKVYNGSIRGTNMELGRLFFDRGIFGDNPDESKIFIKLAANWGNRDAVDFLNEYEATKWR